MNRKHHLLFCYGVCYYFLCECYSNLLKPKNTFCKKIQFKIYIYKHLYRPSIWKTYLIFGFIFYYWFIWISNISKTNKINISIFISLNLIWKLSWFLIFIILKKANYIEVINTGNMCLFMSHFHLLVIIYDFYYKIKEIILYKQNYKYFEIKKLNL